MLLPGLIPDDCHQNPYIVFFRSSQGDSAIWVGLVKIDLGGFLVALTIKESDYCDKV